MLLCADYFLTVLGAKVRERVYALHFKTEHYELNPTWQKTIARKQWFNPRHILVTLLSTGLLAGLLEWGACPPAFAEGVPGCVFIMFGTIIGRHVNNLLLFRRVARQPPELAGQITLTYALTLSMSLYQTIGIAIPLLLLALFSPTPFVLGGLCGVLALIVTHLRWLWRLRRKPPPAAPPPLPGRTAH